MSCETKPGGTIPPTEEPAVVSKKDTPADDLIQKVIEAARQDPRLKLGTGRIYDPF